MTDDEKDEFFPYILDNIGFLLGKTDQLKDRLLDQYLASPEMIEELTATQAKVLFQIKKFENYRPSDIGKMLNVDKSSITRMIDRLEKKGLIKRLPDPDDRRSFLLDLTEKGRLTVEHGMPLAMSALDELEQALTVEEKQQLRHCLRKIVMSSIDDVCLQQLKRGTK